LTNSLSGHRPLRRRLSSSSSTSPVQHRSQVHIAGVASPKHRHQRRSSRPRVVTQPLPRSSQPLPLQSRFDSAGRCRIWVSCERATRTPLPKEPDGTTAAERTHSNSVTEIFPESQSGAMAATVTASSHSGPGDAAGFGSGAGGLWQPGNGADQNREETASAATAAPSHKKLQLDDFQKIRTLGTGTCFLLPPRKSRLTRPSRARYLCPGMSRPTAASPG
jgi:hypothetical protein